MPKAEREVPPINSQEDLDYIKYHSEREFARFLLSKNSIDCFSYEATKFKPKGESKSTTPDFRIISKSGKESFIELTTTPYYEELNDPKEAQRKVINKVSEEIGANILYIVLYYQQLERIQRLNPDLELDFFGNRDNYSPK